MRPFKGRGRMGEDLDDARKPPNLAVGAYGNVIQKPFTSDKAFKPETSGPLVEGGMQRAMAFLILEMGEGVEG
ncbi:hypothetical protein N7512_008445 [Penicillium capsulatum]|nr:hypothetical protein N7512_008445 [Penicillium capsulatum]